MRKTFRYQLEPNKTQAKALKATLRLCCDLYNEAKCLREIVYKTSKKGLSYPEQAFYFKDEKPYCDLHSQILTDTLRRLDKSFQNFFRRIKRGETPGYPRYKAFDRYNSFTYPQPLPRGGFKIIGNKVHLGKIGHIKIYLHRPIPKDAKIKTLTIRRQCGKWYACFSCEVQPKPLPPNTNEIGIDMGLISFIATSNGETISNPRHFKKSEKRLKVIQQSLSRKKRGSKRRYKTKLALRKAHEKVRNQREDFQHKLSRNLINDNGLIAIEDLNIKQMIEKGATKLSKSIGETAWSSFINKLIYKAEEAGRVVIPVNPFGTSSTCYQCGAYRKKDLSERIHKCSCGLVMDRDVHAAMNILKRARAELLLKLYHTLRRVASLRGVPEKMPCFIGHLSLKVSSNSWK
jgi:putative transposase